MKLAATVAAALTAFAVPVLAAEHLEIPGAQSASHLLTPHLSRIRAASDVDMVVAPVGSGPAVLDVIDGRAQAAVVTESLYDAVADARITAWTQERRLLVVKRGLTFHPIATASPRAQPLGFVTMSEPSPQLARVIQYLNSDDGRAALER